MHQPRHSFLDHLCSHPPRRHGCRDCQGAHHTGSDQDAYQDWCLGTPHWASGGLAQDIVAGARLYVYEVNGEMGGRKVELIVEDYEAKTAMALTKVKKLVERDRVHGVVGVIVSAAAIAMKDYIQAQQVPFWSRARQSPNSL